MFLKGALWTIDLAQNSEAAIEPEKLSYVAADQARSAGLPVKRGDFPFNEWKETIGAEIDRLSAQDLEIRKEAAEKFQIELTPEAQLFGRAQDLVSLPGTKSNFRSASK